MSKGTVLLLWLIVIFAIIWVLAVAPGKKSPLYPHPRPTITRSIHR